MAHAASSEYQCGHFIVYAALISISISSLSHFWQAGNFIQPLFARNCSHTQTQMYRDECSHLVSQKCKIWWEKLPEEEKANNILSFDGNSTKILQLLPDVCSTHES